MSKRSGLHLSTAIALLVIAMTLSVGSGRANADHDVEHRIAQFWQRVDALGPVDLLTAADLGQWALNVIERDPGAGLTVADFRASTAAMQAAFDRAGMGIPPGLPKSPDVEERIARFWAKVGALGPADLLSAADLGQWALNVTDRDPNKRIRVDEFRASTAGMQGGFDRARSLPRPPTPAPTPTPSPVVTCAPSGTPARTGLEGRVLWYQTPLANFTVEIREWTIPGPGTLYGSGITDASGRFVITGLPAKGNLEVHLSEQSGYTMIGYGIHTTCGDRVVAVGDLAVRRAITGLSPAHRATVPAGPLRIQWDVVPLATTYCISVYDIAGQVELTPTTPLTPTPLTPPCYRGAVTGSPSFTTPPLVRGKIYSVTVQAFAGAIEIATLLTGNVIFYTAP